MGRKKKLQPFFDEIIPDSQPALDKLTALLDNPEHRTGRVISDKELDEESVTTLFLKGWLQSITDGLYYLKEQGKWEWDDPTPWYMAYWDAVVAYLSGKYGERWCLGSEDSLLYYAENGLIPRQLAVRTPDDETHVVSLPWGYELLVVKSFVPEDVVTNPRFGVRLYPLVPALLAASPGFYLMHPTEARTCLAMELIPGDVAYDAAVTGFRNGAARIAGGLASMGHDRLADSIMEIMDGAGRGVEIVNPFTGDVRIPEEPHAIASRIRLLWIQMHPEVLAARPDCHDTLRPWTPSEVMTMTEGIIIEDAAASLAIWGARASESLARSIADGSWNYDVLVKEAGDEEEVATAAGYFDAFRRVQTDILDSLTGGMEPEMLLGRILEWQEKLVKPMEEHGLMEEGEIGHSYRRHECFVRTLEHIPVGPDEIPHAVHALGELLAAEKDPFVRAVLGGFFLNYIHPVRKVSGLLVRLFMNSQLVTAGYPWITFSGDDADEYVRTLDLACVKNQIRPFAELVSRVIAVSADEEEIR
jgi:hypothetical protein